MDLRWRYTETPIHLIKKEVQALSCILLVGEQLHILALGVEAPI